MTRPPENINFCQFVECHYLDGEVCTHEPCVFNAKIRRWWEWDRVHSNAIFSTPPAGMHKIYNIHAELVDGIYRLNMEVETEPAE